jgi:hypothetical protein
VYDTSSSSLEVIPNYGMTLGYVHGWSARLKSSFTYCCVEIDNQDAQADDSLKATEYSSANLVWDMNSHWMIGVEALWGKRKDKDDTRADDYRMQFTSRFSF